MERLKQILDEYVKKLSNEYRTALATGNATPELSFRPTLDNFLIQLSEYINPKIDRIFEPRQQGKYGRPDWLFCNKETMGIYGYVEAKSFNPTIYIDPAAYENQVKRYLYLGNPVILTDGIDFIMYTPAGKPKNVSICQKPIEWENLTPNTDILPLFQKFFEEEGYRTVSEKQLVSELSKRAIHLSEDLEEILALEEDEAENETERKTIVALKHLWDVASKSHDKSLKNNHTFAGFVAQILAFGLLYAHRFVNEKNIPPVNKYKLLQIFWNSSIFRKDAQRLTPFKTLVDALADELDSSFSKLGIWYDNTRRLLSRIHLTDQQVAAPNFHELYETFLSEYDDKTRRDFGAWYTPMCLANYTVKFVANILPTVIPEETIESKALKIIDPCCGTGTFIEAVLNNLQLQDGSQIIGFEILPVPYALSNYRISMLEIEDKSNIEIVLTNTLSDSTFKRTQIENSATDAVSAFFLKEQQKAKKFSTPPLTVIIGNPPCSDSMDTSNEGKMIAKLMNDFRPSVCKGRSNKQKQLANEMAKFLRWSLFKAEQSRPSVFALILPSTFANNVSFINARKYLSEHVSEMWVLEFDVDNRAGHHAENIFNTVQGRLLLVGTLRELAFELPAIHYKSICAMTKREKETFFKAPVSTDGWISVCLDKNYSFKPTTGVDEKIYSSFWHLLSDNAPAIFERHCSGLKLAPTHLLVHFSKGQLKRRSRFIADENNSYDEIKNRWYKGQVKPPHQAKLTHDVKVALANIDRKIVDYSFRPFLSASLVLDQKLMDALRKTPGGGMRERPEVQAAFAEKNVFGFAVAPAPADICPVIKKFTSFCWSLPDNDLVTRGNSHIFCNRYPEYKTGSKWIGKPKNNVNPTLAEKLSSAFEYSVDEAVDLVVFYSYAVLNSQLYMKTFEGKLHTVAGEWPAIPITKSKNLFDEMANIGKAMANIEKNDFVVDTSLLSKLLGEQLESFPNECKIQSYRVLNSTVILQDTRNNVIFTLHAPNDILQFEVSGYNVIREWLKYHSYAYYRKSCNREDILDLFNLLGKIHEFKKQVILADHAMRKILSSEILKPSLK